MTGIRKLKVLVNFGEQNLSVGELVLSEQKIYFRYEPS